MVDLRLIMLDAIRQRARNYLRSLIPSYRITRYDSLSEMSYQAANVDAAGLHAALRAAEGGEVSQLFAIYRDSVLSDPHIQSEFAKRKLAVLGDTMSIQAIVGSETADAAASFVREQIDGFSGWTRALAHIQDSILWPVSVLEKVYAPTPTGFCLKSLIPVPHTLLDFSSGELRILQTDANGRPIPRSGVAPSNSRYIVHRNHLLTTPDHWGGPMRSILFWWLLGVMDRDWWVRFLDRFGSPFLVGKYDQNDDASRSTLERAFQSAVRIGGLVVTRDTAVEINQAAATTSAEAFEKFYTISRREISKLIVGQTLSAEAQSTGLGSGVANTQALVRDDYRQFDTRVLAETLRDQLFTQLLEINGLPGAAPRVTWGSVSPEEVKATGELVVSLAQARLRIADDGLSQLSERVGLPIERDERDGAVFPPSFLPLAAPRPSSPAIADEAILSVARTGAPDLADAFRGDLAPIARMIRESTSADDLIRRIADYMPPVSPASARVMEEALMTFAANGVAR